MGVAKVDYFMILKVLIVPLWNWNFLSMLTFKSMGCSNRTFMELKCNREGHSCLSTVVLIVPLWNWNHYNAIVLWLPNSSNRTFMELKSHEGAQSCCVIFTCSNRTFMELKFDTGALYRSIKAPVLIVPLWNWNVGGSTGKYDHWCVLIVPLWNWNEGICQPCK